MESLWEREIEEFDLDLYSRMKKINNIEKTGLLNLDGILSIPKYPKYPKSSDFYRPPKKPETRGGHPKDRIKGWTEKQTESWKEKIRKGVKKSWDSLTPDQRAKRSHNMSLSHRGKEKSWKWKLSWAKVWDRRRREGWKQHPQTPEAREKIRLWNFGKRWGESTRKKHSEQMKRIWAQRKAEIMEKKYDTIRHPSCQQGYDLLQSLEKEI